MQIFKNAVAFAGLLIVAAIATPVELDSLALECDTVGPYGPVGLNQDVGIDATNENIAHLGEVTDCEIPALTTKRLACAANSAIYVRNLEDKKMSLKCVNFKASAQNLVNKCQQGKGRFGPAYSSGKTWVTILVSDNCPCPFA